MKIEYEFYEPDIEYEIPENDVIARSMINKTETTFRYYLDSTKVIMNWDGHVIMAVKKMRNKCYFLTKEWKVLELRVKPPETKKDKT